MATCDECGAYENLPYQCHRCGRTFCADHRLPENHGCPGLDDWDDPSKVFDSGFDDSVTTDSHVETDRTRSVTDRVRRRIAAETSTGGVIGYFRGNLTFLFLAAMWTTFLAQLVATVLVGQEFSRSLFVLRPDHLAYVWTWVTSVFAHGNFAHIALNSIVLYFFGPPVERRIGSNRFLALFLSAGVIAGLAQIGMGFVLGSVGPGVVGASGAIMAIMGVLTVLNPHLRVYLYFFIPMPLWLLTVGFAVVSVFFGFGGAAGGIAHWAHLAGLLVGLAYGKHVQGEMRAPSQLRFGGPGGPGGPRGPGGPGR